MLTGVVFSAIVVGATFSMIWGAITYWMGKKYGDESWPMIGWMLVSILGVGIPFLYNFWAPATYWRIVLTTMVGMGAGFCIVFGATYAVMSPLISRPLKMFYAIGAVWVVTMFIVAPMLLKSSPVYP